MPSTADVLDLLASEFGARIGVDCLTEAARWGHDAMIDHLVEEYGVDPNKSDGFWVEGFASDDHVSGFDVKLTAI